LSGWGRVCAAGLEDRVFPLHAGAHTVPSDRFFDAIVSMDAYHCPQSRIPCAYKASALWLLHRGKETQAAELLIPR
jgi:hypothetical protein